MYILSCNKKFFYVSPTIAKTDACGRTTINEKRKKYENTLVVDIPVGQVWMTIQLMESYIILPQILEILKF